MTEVRPSEAHDRKGMASQRRTNGCTRAADRACCQWIIVGRRRVIRDVLRQQQVKEDELESWELHAELREQGDYERLVAHCEEEADRSPGDLQALERLGNAYVLNGNYEKAVRRMLGSRSPGMGEASGQDVGPPDELQGVERHPPPAAAAGLAVEEDLLEPQGK